jgi:hypothetical protein
MLEDIWFIKDNVMMTVVIWWHEFGKKIKRNWNDIMICHYTNDNNSYVVVNAVEKIVQQFNKHVLRPFLIISTIWKIKNLFLNISSFLSDKTHLLFFFKDSLVIFSSSNVFFFFLLSQTSNYQNIMQHEIFTVWNEKPKKIIIEVFDIC